MGRINWPRTRDIIICIIGVGLIVDRVWSLGALFVDAIVILLLASAIAFLVTPAVNLLIRFKIPRLLATLIVYIAVLAAIGGFGYGLVYTLIQQINQFSTTIANFFSDLPSWFNGVQKFLLNQGISQDNINGVLTQIKNQAESFATQTAGSAVSILSIVVNAFLNVLLIVVLSFYLTLDGKRIRDNVVSIVPQRSLPHVLVFEDALNRVVGNYIRGQLTLAAIVGIYVGVVCLVTGLGGYALIVGLLAFIFETIPMVGPGLASIPALLLTVLLPGYFPNTTIEIAVLFVILQILESNILGPRIVGHAVGQHPVAAILSLLIFAKLFGIFGALIATPIVAAVWVVIVSIYRSARGETADQMLARKRAPWIRRPNIPSALRNRRRPTTIGSGHRTQADIVGRATETGPHDDSASYEHEQSIVVGQDEQVQIGHQEEDGKRVVSIEKPVERSK